MDMIRDGIPDILRVDGHNPLKLLHQALSHNLHNESDETCLELATHLRVVLTHIAERVDYVLEDQAELKSAVARLTNKKSTTP